VTDQNKAKHNKTKHNKTKQNKTKQNKQGGDQYIAATKATSKAASAHSNDQHKPGTYVFP
jgi:hypothetical protein